MVLKRKEPAEANIILMATWLEPGERDMSNWALWRANTEPVLVANDYYVEAIAPITVDGTSYQGMATKQGSGNSAPLQLLYPVFQDDGRFEFLLQLPANHFKDIAPEAIAMLQGIEFAN